MLEISRDVMPVFSHESCLTSLPFNTYHANGSHKKMANKWLYSLRTNLEFQVWNNSLLHWRGLVYFYFIDHNAWLENTLYAGPLGMMITKMIGNWHILPLFQLRYQISDLHSDTEIAQVFLHLIKNFTLITSTKTCDEFW